MTMDGNDRQKDSALDGTSRALLKRLQAHIPLVEQPFLAIAQEFGLGEDEVLERIRAMSEARLIRQISAIFDGRALGYQSSLVAARYDPAHLPQAARIVSSHPGVSHNYQRDHDFNLWYTIAVPPHQQLEAAVDELHRLSGAAATRLLPAVRLFKLGVRLDMDETPADARTEGDSAPAQTSCPAPLGECEIMAVRAFQDPFPAIARPFDRAAEAYGFSSTAALLEKANELHARGVMRRFSAVLRHREAGYKANGMVAWKAELDQVDHAGTAMARFEKVSHCYQRTTHPDWPYRLFTMIHGRTPEEVQDCVDAIRAETGLEEYAILYSSAEFKKARVRYFTEEWDQWQAQAGHWEQAVPFPSAGGANPGARKNGAASLDLAESMARRRMDRMRLWGHLQALQACTWDIASLQRRDLDAVREAARLHDGSGMMLTSCQRLETYSLHGCNCGATQRLFGFNALLHLAEVASGLHSVVLGEEQIAGQVRSALASGPAGVRELGDIALAAAREVRAEADFDSHAGHLLDRGLSAAGEHPGGTLLVLGTGHMGRLIARRAHELGFDRVLVAGRRAPEAGWLEEIAGTFIPLATVRETSGVDVLVACLGSEAAELDVSRDLPPVTRLLLDLGTPRNLGGSCSTPHFAIQDLLGNASGATHRDERRVILSERLREKLERRLNMAATDSQSTVGAVRLEVERMRRAELERIQHLHPELPAELMDTVTRALVNRLFHGLTASLSHTDDPELHEQVLAMFTSRSAERRKPNGIPVPSLAELGLNNVRC